MAFLELKLKIKIVEDQICFKIDAKSFHEKEKLMLLGIFLKNHVILSRNPELKSDCGSLFN